MLRHTLHPISKLCLIFCVLTVPHGRPCTATYSSPQIQNGSDGYRIFHRAYLCPPTVSQDNMTSYGLSYFLEDMTGQLTGSDYVDIYGRMRLSMRCTARDSTHTAYMIYNTSPDVYQGSHPKPLVALDFGPNNSLGTVSFASNSALSIPMKKYLVKPSALGSSKVRKFTASDGQEYRWSWRVQVDQEWTCTNTSGYLVAYYSLKPPSEPEYAGSSGCSLTVEEAYPHLAPELLASLMIMRYIAAYNL